VARVHEFKKLENNLVNKIKTVFRKIITAGISGLQAAVRFLMHRWTIVAIPSSEKKVYNLHINIFSILCVMLALVGGGIIVFSSVSSYRVERVNTSNHESRLQDTQASLDQLREEIANALREARNFEDALSVTLSALGTGMNGISPTQSAGTGGDLSSFFDIKESPEGVLQEVTNLRRFTDYLATAVEPLKEVGTLIDSQNALLTEIPSIWPIKGGIGHISFTFGQNIHPFSGQYYIHKGIDLSTYRQGDPIVATADGQVVTVDFDYSGFGNYVIIKHKHGFYTRYAHMLTVRAQIGQRVQQGEIIGYIGNTGLSTGPHLHYEVHIGSDVVDPAQYLNIRATLARANRTNR
jgi:murein DD-endopeptidase MepM/ murein hydrolase activator NlpD